MTELKNALDRYNVSPTRKYYKGIAYFLLGSGPNLSWEVESAKKQLNVEPYYYFDLDSSEIQSLTEIVDPIGDSNYLFVIQTDKLSKFNSQYKPDSNCCVIICLDQGTKDRSTQKKEVDKYEPLNSEYIKVMDLTKYSFLDRKLFKTWYEGLSDQEKKVVGLFYQNPWQLCRFMYNEESILDSTDVQHYFSTRDLDDINYLLPILGSRESIEEWTSMPKGTIYRLFMTPEQEYSGGYTILAGGINSPKRRGLKNTSLEKWHELMPSLTSFKGNYTVSSGKCPELWYYFRMYSKSFLYRWRYRPYNFLLVFTAWVYLTNKAYANRRNRGFEERVSRNNKIYYVFNPSNKAVKVLENLCN